MDSHFHVSEPHTTDTGVTIRTRPAGIPVVTSTGGNDRPHDRTPWGQTKVFRSKDDKKRIARFRRLQKQRGNR